VTAESSGADTGMTKHGYFVVQARVRSFEGDLRVSGVWENLATGDKRSFQSPEELCLLFREWGLTGAARRTRPSQPHVI